MQAFRQNQTFTHYNRPVRFSLETWFLRNTVFKWNLPKSIAKILQRNGKTNCVRDDLITLDLLWFIFLWITHSLSLIQSVSSTLMLCFIVTWLRFKDQNFLSHQRHECSGLFLHVNRVNLDPRWTNTYKIKMRYRRIPKAGVGGVCQWVKIFWFNDETSPNRILVQWSHHHQYWPILFKSARNWPFKVNKEW